MFCCVLKTRFQLHFISVVIFLQQLYSLVRVDILHRNEIVLALTSPEYPLIGQKVSEIGDRVQLKLGNREYLDREKCRNFPVNPLVQLKDSNQNLNQNPCHFDRKENLSKKIT